LDYNIVSSSGTDHKGEVVATSLTVLDLPAQQLSALKRKARRMGLTPAMYIKRLIEDDLVLDRKAKTTSLDELAAPFRKALKGMSEHQLDRVVDAARTKHAVRSTKRGRRR
jgi:hypothetical protein